MRGTSEKKTSGDLNAAKGMCQCKEAIMIQMLGARGY